MHPGSAPELPTAGDEVQSVGVGYEGPSLSTTVTIEGNFDGYIRSSAWKTEEARDEACEHDRSASRNDETTASGTMHVPDCRRQVFPSGRKCGPVERLIFTRHSLLPHACADVEATEERHEIVEAQGARSRPRSERDRFAGEALANDRLRGDCRNEWAIFAFCDQVPRSTEGRPCVSLPSIDTTIPPRCSPKPRKPAAR